MLYFPTLISVQAFADALKLLSKEYVSPTQANLALFFLGPVILLIFSLLSYFVIPYGPGLALSDINLSILFMLVVSSLSTYGLLWAGWSTYSKYAFFGSLRSRAQLNSYELILSSAILIVVLLTGSLNLTVNVDVQRLLWTILPLYLLFIILYINYIVETNKTYFDLAIKQNLHSYKDFSHIKIFYKSIDWKGVFIFLINVNPSIYVFIWLQIFVHFFAIDPVLSISSANLLADNVLLATGGNPIPHIGGGGGNPGLPIGGPGNPQPPIGGPGNPQPPIGGAVMPNVINDQDVNPIFNNRLQVVHNKLGELEGVVSNTSPNKGLCMNSTRLQGLNFTSIDREVMQQHITNSHPDMMFRFTTTISNGFSYTHPVTTEIRALFKPV